MLSRHRRKLTLATPCLPLDEAIVTVPVRPSVTKQAGSSRQAGPSSTAKVPVLVGTLFQSRLLPTPWIMFLIQLSTQIDSSLACHSNSCCM